MICFYKNDSSCKSNAFFWKKQLNSQLYKNLFLTVPKIDEIHNAAK